MKYSREKIGVICVLITAVFEGLFPILVNRGGHIMPPITFAAFSILMAAVACFIYALASGSLREVLNRKAYKPILMVAICIVIIPYTLFFIGASKTSGINTSILMLAEIIFTLIFTHFIGEKTTWAKIAGTGCVFLGALFILYNGAFSLNLGDILIILSTILYPIGNFYSKKALQLVSPSIILFLRFAIGGLFILGFSLILEPRTNFKNVISIGWPLILINGVLIFSIVKIVWYEGLKRLDISKAISLFQTFPLFSLLILAVVFKESISVTQWIGVAIMMVGIYFSVKRSSVNPELTKYNLTN